MVSAMAAETIVTNKPALVLFVVPTPSELKRTNRYALDTGKSSNQPAALPRLTNTVEDLSAEFTESALTESVLHAERFERMNGRPFLESRGGAPKRFFDRLPLSGGALLSRNPNARRNPLEVDGW
jgi:hypothetical protein